MSLLLTIIGFFIVLGPLVFFHELGHFVFAKLARIRVIEFGFGYPPRLWKFRQSAGRITIAGVHVTIPQNFKAPLSKQDLAWLSKKTSTAQPDQPERLDQLEAEWDPATQTIRAKPASDQSAGFGRLDNLMPKPGDVMDVVENGRYVQATLALRPDGSRVLQSIKLLNPSTEDATSLHTPTQVRGQVTDYVPGTEYTLNWLPVGGFTRMLGEEDPSAPDSFAAAPKRWRSAVLLAGPGFNLVLAVVIFMLTFMTGWPEPKDYRVAIGSVQAGSPAATAGLEPGDLILAINRQTTTTADQVSRITHANLGQEITLSIQRNQEKLDLHVTPRRAGEYDPKQEGPLGITIGAIPTGFEVRQYSPFDALPRAVDQTVTIIRFVVAVPVQVVRGLIPLNLARPIGPVGIGQLAGSQVEESIRLRGLYPILSLAGLLSIALGLTNLLPLPALDGGRLMFIIVEAIRRRRVDPKKETVVHLIGLAFLLTVMLIITLQDILNPIAIPKSF